MDVGIREFKAKASEYIRRAAEGERIRITDRGVPQVVLTPATPVDRIARGIKEGWITVGPAASEPPSVPRRFSSPVSSMSILDEDRGF